MFRCVQAALEDCGLKDKYWQLFEQNEVDDAVVAQCLQDPLELKEVMPVVGHRIKFIKSFRKTQVPETRANATVSQQVSLVDLDSDGEENGSTPSCSYITSLPTKKTRNPEREFKSLTKEAHNTALKFYRSKMDEFFGGSSVLFFDEENLSATHQENKAKAVEEFTTSYKKYRPISRKRIRVQNELGQSEESFVKQEPGEDDNGVDEDLISKQNELLSTIEKAFESYKEKNELRHSNFNSSATAVREEAEKLYVTKMTIVFDTCHHDDEKELAEKEKKVNEEVLEHLMDKINGFQNKTSPQLIEGLIATFKESISNWFEEKLKSLRLMAEKEQMEKTKALSSLKTYYNEEMEKLFLSNNTFLPQSELVKRHEEITDAALTFVKEKYQETTFVFTPAHTQEFTNVCSIMFKKHEEKNKMRRSTTSSYAIGIDLGTTNSCVAVYMNEKVEVIPNENGNNTTPSVISFEDDGSKVVGDAAKELALRNPRNTIFEVKRLIGKKFDDSNVQQSIKMLPFSVVEFNGQVKVQIDSTKPNDGEADSVSARSHSTRHKKRKRLEALETFHPEEISSLVLKKMKEIAEDYLGSKVESCVVTVPALFNDSQRQATKDAGAIAGLKVLRIINEPTSAAIAYQLHRLDDLERKVLVFDLGGGTFDVSVLKILGGKIKVEAVHGKNNLGGGNFDETMVNHCIEWFKKKYKVDLARGRDSDSLKERTDASNRLRRIRNKCEEQKKVLSEADETFVGMEVVDSEYPEFNLDVPFTRDLFNSLNQDLFEKCIKVVKKVLAEAKMDKSEIDDVVLVGGSTRIPKIQEMLSEFFGGKDLCSSIHPDEAVAVGAAIQACILNGEEVERFTNPSLTLSDVNPLSIGLEDGRTGKMEVWIKKNTAIPCLLTNDWFTLDDYQTSINLVVYEGENPVASKNNLLGEFKLEGIPADEAYKEKVKVTMSISEEGILSVLAKCVSNGVSATLKITEYKSRLTKQDIRQASVRMSKSTSRSAVEEVFEDLD